ncbi:antibiotic biosynthesis monooxygenase [Dictyobacter alpinus]|uniref:antibiotic biosynthesis monooxygenase n=1 Tax=Dictyobacter alpinus TaxID=2014873 RepID=UPI000F81B2F4|nr:antibiotic biosynthesis monooxygenase [Dictyobacter alpinus]
MQHSSELLVVTLARIQSGKDIEARGRIRSIVETLRSAPGLISTRMYSGQSNGLFYLLFTTWDDEESWLKAQERHTPRQLLSVHMKDLLMVPPEQWLMYYLWGYSKPTQPPQFAAVQLMGVTPQRIQQVQQTWLTGLQQPELQSLLTFAFFARGINDTPTATRITTTSPSTSYRELFSQRSSLLLCFFSWSDEIEREDFYAQRIYQNLKKSTEKEGTIMLLPLENQQ